MKVFKDRIMLLLVVLAGSLLVATLWAGPSGILSSSMIFSRMNIADAMFVRNFPLARALDEIARGAEGPFSGTTILHPDALAAVYETRGYVPLWFSGEKLSPGAKYLLDVFSSAEIHGLDPDKYIINPGSHGLYGKVVLELMITDTLFAYAHDLGVGRFDPGSVYWKWEPSEGCNTSALVTRAMISFLERAPWPGGAFSVETLANLLTHFQPPQDEYSHLMQALAEHRDIQKKGGWPLVSAKVGLQVGDVDHSVLGLRKRLFVSGDYLNEKKLQNSIFDHGLELGVRAFQKRCGLVESGYVDKGTLAALNVTADKRAQCICWNMERMRWLTRDQGALNVWVNIPAFDLQMRDAAGVVGTMAVVVGRTRRPTPVMSKDLSEMVVNPYWNVPSKLARYDILPAVVRDSTYLTDRGFHVYSGWDFDHQEIDAAAICWREIVPGDMTYQFRQDPGPRNALGKIKFLFSNKYAVYLHDTNNKSVFSSSRRALSSGCVRLEKPAALAGFITEGRGEVMSLLEGLMASGETRTIAVESEVRLHLVYMTAFVDECGVTNFRPDIYQYDKRMAKIMEQY